MLEKFRLLFKTVRDKRIVCNEWLGHHRHINIFSFHTNHVKCSYILDILLTNPGLYFCHNQQQRTITNEQQENYAAKNEEQKQHVPFSVVTAIYSFYACLTCIMLDNA